ncbi:MAG: LamB/YcsF family protein, partial [Mangrovicoccus sp.]|nr:LamB/YcsF family protein [Mangrovicoccus sp.]
ALIHDPETAAWRMVDMVAAGGILTATGHRIPTRIDTICLHGDTPDAVAMARAVRSALGEAAVRIAAPGSH